MDERYSANHPPAFKSGEPYFELTCVQRTPCARFIEARLRSDCRGRGLAVIGDLDRDIGEVQFEIMRQRAHPSGCSDDGLTSSQTFKGRPSVDRRVGRKLVLQRGNARKRFDARDAVTVFDALANPIENRAYLSFVTRKQPLRSKPKRGEGDGNRQKALGQNALGPIRRARVDVPNSCCAIGMPRLSPTTK